MYVLFAFLSDFYFCQGVVCLFLTCEFEYHFRIFRLSFSRHLKNVSNNSNVVRKDILTQNSIQAIFQVSTSTVSQIHYNSFRWGLPFLKKKEICRMFVNRHNYVSEYLKNCVNFKIVSRICYIDFEYQNLSVFFPVRETYILRILLE